MASAESQGNIVNERLDAARIRRIDALGRFKVGVAERSTVLRDLIVDVGCGSGSFLYHVRDRFTRHLGVEISPECVAFSRDVLGLAVAHDLSALREAPSLVTFWHSLEHFPSRAAEQVLSRIAELSRPETRIVMSVPNGRSLQRRLFGAGYAYDDVANHVHQFCPDSLDLVMGRHGFERQETVSGFAYAYFGWLQGALNLFSPSRLHNYLYYRIRRGVDFGLPSFQRMLLDSWEACLAVGLAVPSGIAVLFDYCAKRHGGVFTAVYSPRLPAPRR
jgi:SAM-dependent methyltransferase